MIRYYLGEEPILSNAPTYLPIDPTDKQYILDHLDTLVVKDVAEAGGYGVVFGSKLTREQLGDCGRPFWPIPAGSLPRKSSIFQDLPIMDQGQKVERKADLRAFVLSGAAETLVWPSGLTRFSRNPDSFIVNSSQGGGFKDTWILSR